MDESEKAFASHFTLRDTSEDIISHVISQKPPEFLIILISCHAKDLINQSLWILQLGPLSRKKKNPNI